MLTDLECRSAFASTPNPKRGDGWHWVGPSTKTGAALKVALKQLSPWPAYCVVTALSNSEEIGKAPYFLWAININGIR